jgi:predicted metal-dependent hydrolase
MSSITLCGLSIRVTRKPIKHLYLKVHPLDGGISLSAPDTMQWDELEQFVRCKLAWIQRHRDRIQSQPLPSHRQWQSGETHYFQGQAYELALHPTVGKAQVHRTAHTLELHSPPHSTTPQRQQILQQWYRHQLKLMIPPLLHHWQTQIGVTVQEWRIKQMKTRWGSCNVVAKRIWLNLELVKFSPACVEYVLVHELIHLLEPSHNARFYRLMDQFLPAWRDRKAELEARWYC